MISSSDRPVSAEKKADRQRAFERVEEAAMYLIYVAEQWTCTGATMHDWKVRRRNLLSAAREYGRAMDSLGRVR